ncbi:hypothetical protein DPMN_068774 [Dreissena polymorpha]|uniref:Uncharacterized protein n=1 Tax=Dreissena polymorpha TaxID=45954 RepID=A0A9D3YZT7_DREPO|nr:hypothetical protein DPMN_068774 [Dreissena polymorpha]
MSWADPFHPTDSKEMTKTIVADSSEKTMIESNEMAETIEADSSGNTMIEWSGQVRSMNSRPAEKGLHSPTRKTSLVPGMKHAVGPCVNIPSQQ